MWEYSHSGNLNSINNTALNLVRAVAIRNGYTFASNFSCQNAVSNHFIRSCGNRLQIKTLLLLSNYNREACEYATFPFATSFVLRMGCTCAVALSLIINYHCKKEFVNSCYSARIYTFGKYLLGRILSGICRCRHNKRLAYCHHNI